MSFIQTLLFFFLCAVAGGVGIELLDSGSGVGCLKMADKYFFKLCAKFEMTWSRMFENGG